jgi:hypothetical protein
VKIRSDPQEIGPIANPGRTEKKFLTQSEPLLPGASGACSLDGGGGQRAHRGGLGGDRDGVGY